MKPRITVLVRIAALMVWTTCAAAAGLSGAHYEEPVERYGHFAPGRPHEYARVAAASDSGVRLVLDLPDDEVFEDIVPRVVRLAPDRSDLLLTIVSHRRTGSRLVLIGERDRQLVIVAQSTPTGSPKRWLNPVGAADLDRDGQTEIAVVTTPHIGGTLRVYRRSGDALVEIAALSGFANHVFGSSELRLSTIVDVDGASLIVVPDTTRRALVLVALTDGRLVERGRCALQGALVGPVLQDTAATLTAVTDAGLEKIVLADCR